MIVIDRLDDHDALTGGDKHGVIPADLAVIKGVDAIGNFNGLRLGQSPIGHDQWHDQKPHESHDRVAFEHKSEPPNGIANVFKQTT